MSRPLAEAWVKAHSASSGRSVAFIPPPLPLLKTCITRPRLSTNPQNQIAHNSLHPLVPAMQCLTKWLTHTYGLVHLDVLSHQFPVDIITCCHLCLANSIQPSTLSNYLASLLRFMKFSDDD